MTRLFDDQYDYKIPDEKHDSWYKAKPYCFRINTDTSKLSFYLPINPSNLSISTHFATNVISTVYGTVEEHSEQRYFDIVITGTTGMAPQNHEYINEGGKKEDSIKEDVVESRRKESSWDMIKRLSKSVLMAENNSSSSRGRKSYSTSESSLGGFMSRTQSLVGNAVNKVTDIIGTGDKPYESAVTDSKSGYIAFHNFYRFLLAYKKEVVGKNNTRKRGDHPIKFINYKDNNQYNVAIQTFQLTRSVDDPMLYKYNIVMRGYQLETADKPSFEPIDKEADLGLDGVESISVKARLSNGARDAKNALASAVGAVKGFGS